MAARKDRTGLGLKEEACPALTPPPKNPRSFLVSQVKMQASRAETPEARRGLWPAQRQWKPWQEPGPCLQSPSAVGARCLEEAAPAPAAGGFPSHHPAWFSPEEPTLSSRGPFQVSWLVSASSQTPHLTLHSAGLPPGSAAVSVTTTVVGVHHVPLHCTCRTPALS